jgi:ATP-dependent Lon protease
MASIQQLKKIKQDSKDDAIVIVDEESNKPQEETPLVDEGIKDELKEETRVVQDIEQGDEDIEEEDNPEGWSFNLNHELKKKEQIPSEYNEEQTLRIIRKQNQIPGEGKRSRTINDMPNATALAWLLKHFEFPAYKSKIIEFIQQAKNSDPNSNQILPVLDRIEKRQYQNIADISLSAKLVQWLEQVTKLKVMLN